MTHEHALGGHLWHLLIGGVPVAAAGMAIAIDRIRGVSDDPAVQRPATRALLSAESFGVGVARVSPSPTVTPRSRPERDTRRPMPLLLAVAGCLAAAAIHVDVAPEHFRESAVYGAFFVAVALAQIAAAWVLWRRPILTCLRVVALGSLAIVALWAWTRSVGVPLGPDAGHTEVVGLLDVLCASAELVTAIGCLALSGAIHVATSGSAGRVIPPAGFKTVAPISRST